jgi:hypothetical protein
MLFHAIIESIRPNDLAHRTSVEAPSEDEARRLLESEYGVGRILQLWMDHEERKVLPSSILREK